MNIKHIAIFLGCLSFTQSGFGMDTPSQKRPPNPTDNLIAAGFSALSGLTIGLMDRGDHYGNAFTKSNALPLALSVVLCSACTSNPHEIKPDEIRELSKPKLLVRALAINASSAILGYLTSRTIKGLLYRNPASYSFDTIMLVLFFPTALLQNPS